MEGNRTREPASLKLKKLTFLLKVLLFSRFCHKPLQIRFYAYNSRKLSYGMVRKKKPARSEFEAVSFYTKLYTNFYNYEKKIYEKEKF